MREIKFEFLFKGMPFSSDNKEFNWHKKVYSLDQIISSSLDELCGGSEILGELVARRQYTGLKDKDGVEIYEGDLAKNDRGRTCKIVWNEYCACFDCEYVSDDNSQPNPSIDKSYGFKCSMWARNITKIGNIHQNPELSGDS